MKKHKPARHHSSRNESGGAGQPAGLARVSLLVLILNGVLLFLFGIVMRNSVASNMSEFSSELTADGPIWMVGGGVTQACAAWLMFSRRSKLSQEEKGRRSRRSARGKRNGRHVRFGVRSE